MELMTKNNFKKTVFFDLGNVILLFCHQKMCKQVAECSGVPLSLVEEALLKSPYADLYERGGLDNHALHKKFCEHFSSPVSLDDFYSAFSDIFTLNEEILHVIEKLKRNNVELIILSNTCPAHFEYALKNYPVLSLFDSYILSYEVGARKPENKIFQHALAKSSSEIKNCFYTDDIQQYVESAQNLGIKAHTFTNAQLLENELHKQGFL